MRIRSCIRPFELIARRGGEALVIARVGCDAAPAVAVAERMRARVAAQPILFADEARCRAKQGGRDRAEPRSCSWAGGHATLTGST